jgi:hypothetical protein
MTKEQQSHAKKSRRYAFHLILLSGIERLHSPG